MTIAGTQHPIVTAACTARDALAGVADANPTFLDPDAMAEALVTIESVREMAHELELRLLASAQPLAEVTGHRDAGTWLADTTHQTRRTLARDLCLAQAFESHPRVAAAVREQRATVGQAHAIIDALDALPATVPAEVVVLAETTLIGYATQFDPVEIRRLGRCILDTVAPEVAEDHEARALLALDRDARENQRLSLTCLGDGTTRISGVVLDTTAARLAIVLHAHSNPRRDHLNRDTDRPTEPILEPVRPDPARRMPFPRRAAEALNEFLEGVDVTALPQHGRNATTLLVTINLASLQQEVATATLLGPAPGSTEHAASLDTLTASEARRLACNAQIIPLVLGGKSQILDQGRAQRFFTTAQDTAMRFRDRTCRIEGCDIPGAWCEAHHWKPWAHGGPTNLDDGGLLCRHHHHVIHTGSFEPEFLDTGRVRLNRRG